MLNHTNKKLRVDDGEKVLNRIETFGSLRTRVRARARARKRKDLTEAEVVFPDGDGDAAMSQTISFY